MSEQLTSDSGDGPGFDHRLGPCFAPFAHNPTHLTAYAGPPHPSVRDSARQELCMLSCCSQEIFAALYPYC
ncbi:hypothetical protein DD237_008528 [Peronospora effusa]|uniref:Uncharacterized protein n=1 Tax=Peronospora effusa TaxID=542832 RepID=A0A3R7XN75_9STRA|nr:hypothetical protein DD237_008528 [Peronospora effusa]